MIRRIAFVAAIAFAATGAGTADAGPKGCPPGLAKKSPACVPPGLAKKAYPERGDHIGNYPYQLIDNPLRYRLEPLRPGERYYLIDGRIFRVDDGTYEVLDFLGAAAALLN